MSYHLHLDSRAQGCSELRDPCSQVGAGLSPEGGLFKKVSPFGLRTILYKQGRSQPHIPGWARVPLSSVFPQVLINFLIFPQAVLILGPGYATGGSSRERPFADIPHLNWKPTSRTFDSIV